MMGKSHAISGAAAWIALTTTTNYSVSASWIDLGVNPHASRWAYFATLVVGAFVTAGAALLPDIDHPSSTISRAGGAATRAVSGVASVVSGGHRHGLHSLLAVVGAMLLTQFAFDNAHPGVVVAIVVALTALTVKVLKLGRKGRIAVVGAGLLCAASVFGQSFGVSFDWLPQAIGVGFLMHLVGDFMTTGGLPLVWPLSVKPPQSLHHVPVLSSIWKPNGYMALPVLGDTGSVREGILASVMAAYTLVVLSLTISA